MAGFKYVHKGRCPRCGAVPSVQNHPQKRMVDFNAYTRISEMHPADANLCPRCGLAFYCVSLEHEDGILISNYEGEILPDYCPRCGTELGDTND